MNSRFSKLAITSLIAGILGLVLIPPLLSLAALIFGFIALKAINRSSDTLQGKGLAISGVVLGGIVWLFIISALLLALTIRMHYQPFRIPTMSMAPTIKSGEKVIIDREAYVSKNPERGDMTVFYSPQGKHTLYLKRVIGLPKETLEIRDGNIYINDALTKVPGVSRSTYYINAGIFGRVGQKILIPENSYYVLGDNSQSSLDSRYFGFVNNKKICGKIVAISEGSQEELTIELVKLFFHIK